jgi:putative heme-binding domain-containing protein
VRRYLASAVQRVPEATAWRLIEALALHEEDREDRNIPSLLWTGMALRMTSDTDRAFNVARQTRIPALADAIYWYAATLDGRALNQSVAHLTGVQGETLRRRLAGLELAMKPRANVAIPAAWKTVAPALHAHSDPRVVRQARRLAAVFGDQSVFPELRVTLADQTAGIEARQEAFAVLGRAQDREALPLFLGLMDEKAFQSQAIGVLAQFDSPKVPDVLIQQYPELSAANQAAVLVALTGRPSFALALLDAVSAGTLRRDQLNSFHIRQLTQLNHPEINRRVAASWGRIHQSPAEKQALMRRLETDFGEAPLWAYSAREGQRHFETLCVSCHGAQGAEPPLGPSLAGSGRNGIRYFLENIIDPNAVIGTDFQMTTVERRDGEALSGLLVSETDSAITLRTTAGESVVAKADMSRRVAGDISLMPEDLLESLNDREQLELLKFLTGL